MEVNTSLTNNKQMKKVKSNIDERFELIEQSMFNQFNNPLNDSVNEALEKNNVMKDVFEENMKDGNRLSDYQAKNRLTSAHLITIKEYDVKKRMGGVCNPLDWEHAFRMMNSGPAYGGRAGKLLEELALENLHNSFDNHPNCKSIKGQVSKPGFGQNFDAYVERNDGAWIGVMIQRDLHHGGAQANRGVAYAKKSITIESPNKMLMLVSNEPATYSRGRGKNALYNAYSDGNAYKNLVWMSSMLEQVSDWLNEA